MMRIKKRSSGKKVKPVCLIGGLCTRSVKNDVIFFAPFLTWAIKNYAVFTTVYTSITVLLWSYSEHNIRCTIGKSNVTKNIIGEASQPRHFKRITTILVNHSNSNVHSTERLILQLCNNL